ncbi:glycosyltransferase family 4 protein [Paenibacillus sp. MBLB4367]|uniref:glycosyltransferase family 4 protein n=1 Tax=Paenibacillus sp. MBLB4367 TaxID=3384767 RepID=UPI003908220D
MRILFMYVIPGGGVDTLNRMRCHALARRGIECHCLYFHPGSGLQNINAEGIPTFITKDPAGMMGIVNQYQYNAIVVTSAYLEARMLRQFGYKGAVIFENQGLGTMDMARHETLAGKDCINAYSDAILLPLTEHLHALYDEMLPHKMRFSFNNPIDTSLFSYRKKISETSPILGWFGRMEYNKNWRDFLFIAYNLLEHFPDLKLWMFHDHTLAQQGETEAFELTVSDLGLRDRLVLRSNVPHAEMPDIYSAIGDSGGLTVSTSRVEGAGYVIYEAMGCRCPVLTTDSDGVRTAVIHNYSGKFYAHGDIDGAVREALELMKDTKLRGQIRAQAWKHVEEHFSIERYSVNFVNMLQQLGVM